MDPVDALVSEVSDALTAAGISGVSVVDGPRNQIKPPIVVIRPDNPWIVPDRFCADQQRYQAVMVVTAATPGDGRRMLYGIGKAIRAAMGMAWSWESITPPIVDESTGTPFLAAGVRLIYRNEEEEES
jgi:hypothetical protein